MDQTMAFHGKLKGHGGWVTCIASSYESPNMLVSGSRDKKVMVWELVEDTESVGYARRCLHGHNGFVQDLTISSDGQFVLSGSWDATLRLWDLNTGSSVRTFIGHGKEVFSVAFSADNRQIVSSSRDKTIKLWNTLAECKYTIVEENHQDWISCVRFSPSAKTPLLVSCGWDKLVKVWNLTNMKLRTNLVGHTGPLYTVTVSPDGSLCASGGKDGTVMLWDVTDGKHLYSLDAGNTINSLVFSPKNYWLVAATDSSVKIWDLENKELLDEIRVGIEEVTADETKKRNVVPISVQWSADGNFLFIGCTDNNIHVYDITN